MAWERKLHCVCRVGPIGLLCFVVWLAASLASQAQSEDPAQFEYRVKAAFLFNFIKFVEWPSTVFPQPASPITIGVLGDDPVSKALNETIRGKTIDGRELRIRKIAAVEEATACQVLFISHTEKDRLGEILPQLGSANVLTVGEVEGFLQSGGMINFVMQDKKVRFEVGLDAANRSGIKISSKLLELALSKKGGK